MVIWHAALKALQRLASRQHYRAVCNKQRQFSRRHKHKHEGTFSHLSTYGRGYEAVLQSSICPSVPFVRWLHGMPVSNYSGGISLRYSPKQQSNRFERRFLPPFVDECRPSVVAATAVCPLYAE